MLGGGAHGLSHIRALKALEEANTPIDFIGGTSMGAFIGALYASTCNGNDVHIISSEWAKDMGSLWYLLPHTSTATTSLQIKTMF